MGRSLIISSTNSLHIFSTSATKRCPSVPTNYQPNHFTPFPSLRLTLTGTCTSTGTGTRPSRVPFPFPFRFAKPGRETGTSESEDVGPTVSVRVREDAIQVVLWAMEAVYILWLFLLPYAPGDPVWAINQSTVNDLLGLSLNFFFILPLLNSVGINLIEAPVLHPMAEGLFNFVIAWTLMFAPLLFTDCKRDRYKGSLDLLWGFQMFLTNTFLIPYMAIRLNEKDPNQSPPKLSKLGSVMVQGAPLVGLIGGSVCFLSLIWAFFGRGGEQFGGLTERAQYLVSYLGSERLAYAFIWDIVLYSIFQPWLIAENIENVKRDDVGFVNWLRFIPVVGLFFYLLSLDVNKKDS